MKMNVLSIGTGLFILFLVSGIHAQENPYLKELNKWFDSKQTKNLDNLYPTGGATRGVGDIVIRRAWGLTHPLSEMESSVYYDYHKTRLAEEIDYLLTVAENYNGRFTNESNWNVDRFVLRHLIDALNLLDKAGIYQDSISSWKQRLRLPLDFQYENYWYGPGQEQLPGLNSSAGYYPNSDAIYVLLMGAAGELYGETKYSERAHQFVQRLNDQLFPDGAFPYAFTTCDIPVYHSIVISNLARYWQITGDTLARDVIVNSQGYYPITFGSQFRAEETPYPWWKRQMGTDIGPSTMDIVATLSNCGENKYIAQRFEHNASASYVAVDFWTDTIVPVPPMDTTLLYDHNVNGVRGRFGQFSWLGMLGHEYANDAFIGAMLTNESSRGSSLNAEFKFVTPEVILEENNKMLYKRAAFTTGGTASGSVVKGNELGAVATTYQLHKPWKEEPQGVVVNKTSVPWTVHQIWLMTSDNVSGHVILTSELEQNHPEVRNRVRFAPVNSVEKVSDGLYKSNNLRLNILQHNFDEILIDEAVQTGENVFDQDQLGDEIFFSEGQRQFAANEKLKLAFSVYPKNSETGKFYQQVHVSGCSGFQVFSGEQWYLLLFNASGVSQQIDFNAHHPVMAYNDTSGIPFLEGVTAISTGLGPYGLLVLQSDSLIYGQKELNLTIEVEDDQNRLLSDIPVEFDGNTYTTDMEGKVFITNIPVGAYDLSIHIEGFQKYNNDGLELVRDTIVRVQMQKKPRTIRVQLVDGNTGDPVYRALVRYAGQTFYSNQDGEVTIVSGENQDTVIIRASGEEYFQCTDTLMITSDTIIQMKMINHHATLGFEVFEDDYKRSDVQIVINRERSVFTDQSGHAYFTFVPAKSWHQYEINVGDEVMISDSVYLLTDTVIRVNLAKVAIDKIITEADNVLVYPNPAKNRIKVGIHEVNGLDWMEVKLMDIDGKMISVKKAKGKTITLDVSGLPQGLYLLKICAQGHCYNKRFGISR